jgi:hypothetical protein
VLPAGASWFASGGTYREEPSADPTPGLGALLLHKYDLRDQLWARPTRLRMQPRIGDLDTRHRPATLLVTHDVEETGSRRRRGEEAPGS